jgi:hypothetical protein
MKGGITSGVVYPLAICELATTYRLRHIGGTSAGAIAAAAAAAAELGRVVPAAGFGKLSEQPTWLGTGTRLHDLFQPEKQTRRVYETLTAGFGTRNKALRVAKTVGAALLRFVGWSLLGALPGLSIIALTIWSESVRWPGAMIGSAILVAVLGAILASFLGLGLKLVRALPENRFGLCSGRSPSPGTGPPALTDWLADLVDQLAGRPTKGRPLTFSDLWKGPEGTGTFWDRAIDLQMLTTSLSEGRPYRLPLEGLWFFHPEELSHIFPDRVMSQMITAGNDLLHRVDTTGDLAEKEWPRVLRQLVHAQGLVPLPRPEDLPVVVAARLSLSFPVLLSAVPLHTVDFDVEANQQTRREWSTWLRAARDGSRDVWGRALEEPDRPQSSLRTTKCWFSDGGIASNFPLPLFDGPVPRWPTFGINLTPFPPDKPPEPVWMPTDNSGGMVARLRRLQTSPGIGSVVGFGRAIFDTMQNWADNAQTRVPGFRDRIAHVRHYDYEGGLNLRMGREDIVALSERGATAGRMLRERYSSSPPEGTVLDWDNHRWVRLRTFLGQLEEQVAVLSQNLDYEEEESARVPYRALLEEDRQPSYRVRGKQLALLRDELARLGGLVDARNASGTSTNERSPRPTPELKIRPRL